MIIALIIACEIGFWVLLVAGLLLRYVLRLPRCGQALLLCVPLVDLVLLVASAYDLKQGNTAEFAHGLAALYLGFTVVYGHETVSWMDQWAAYLFAGGAKPSKTELYAYEYTLQQWRHWFKAAKAGAIAMALLMAAIVFVDRPEQTAALHDWFGSIISVLFTWFLCGPLWYSVFPKKPKPSA